jgi:hypothetical protein
VTRTAVFLSGIAATVTGAFIRSCNSGVGIDLASAWCGKPPPGMTSLETHAHCPGCAVAFAGLLLISVATASMIGAWNQQGAKAMVRQ